MASASEYPIVEGSQQVHRVVDALAAGSGPIAVDVERASGFRYSQRAYLLQIFRRDSGVFLIDPTTVDDFTDLHEVMGSEEWVLHAASQDLPSLRELGFVPNQLFDTELAARLAGFERVGLGAVVERALGITLAKEHSAADWSQRPLPMSWREYAALDVLYLVDVRDFLAEELDQQGKSEFASQEFAAAASREPKPPKAERWRRINGLHQVRTGSGLAIARELWEAREEFARDQDIAPGRLVPDRALVAAVLANPTSKRQLASLGEFTGRASRTELDRWWQAIERGRSATPPQKRAPVTDTLPAPRTWADRNPEADARLRQARPQLEAVAQSLQIPQENLLTPEILRRVSWQPPADLSEQTLGQTLQELGARPWQVAETVRPILEAFAQAAQSPVESSEENS